MPKKMKNYIITFSGVLKDGRRTEIRQSTIRCKKEELNNRVQEVISRNKLENETYISTSVYQKTSSLEFNF